MSDILDAIVAIHSREERCEKLELLYRNEEEKRKIYEALVGTRCREENRIEIETIDEGEGHGFISIEFHDDYDNDADPFFDTLIKKLGIDRCE